jgi:LytS/YehU family sensor histidine kinase
MFSIALYQSMDENQDDALIRTPLLLGIVSGFSAFALFIGGLTTLQLFKYRIENRHRIDELQSATMEIELANLQNQINPHFLFNMLNNANIMAGEDAGKSSYMLSKLNDLLRYQVEEGSKETVKLKDDITFIGDYLELEKMRRDRFNYTIHSEGNAEIDVPPLLFIPFVENAVKHNPESDSYVAIIFRMKDQHLYFECKNPKARLTYAKKEGGIGLINIKKRLDLLFGKSYSLHLQDEKESYKVTMEFKI